MTALPTQPCPFCSEQILETTIKCRYCGELLIDDNKNKITEKPKEYQPKLKPEKNESKNRVFLSGGGSKANRYRSKKNTEFILSALGITLALVIILFVFNDAGEWFSSGQNKKNNSQWQIKEKTICTTAGTITTCTTKEKK